jgi:hypothetical protein
VVVSGNAVVSLYAYKDAAVRLSAWAPGTSAATELDTRAYPDRAAIAASPSGRYVAFVRVADLFGETGHVQIRRRDGSGVAVSPAEARDLDLIGCQTELRFHDETHVVAFYCQKDAALPRVVVIDAESGAVVALSEVKRGSEEAVDQVQFVPGGRVVWSNLLSSRFDPGALKAGTIDGAVRQLLSRDVPRRQVAQLTLSPDGTTAYYLTGTRALQKISVVTGAALVLAPPPDPAERLLIAGVAPDGRTLALLRQKNLAPDRLALIDTNTRTSIEAQLGSGLALAGPVFTADSLLAVYLTDNDVLSAYPVRGGDRITVRSRVSRYLPLAGSHLLVLHDAMADRDAVASRIDAQAPAGMGTRELDRGLNPSPAGFWLLSPDRSKLVYLKGSGIYVTPVP